MRNVTFTAHVVPKPEVHGYWMLGADGAVYPFGAAPELGNPVDPTVAHLTPTATARGYWIVNSRGHVYAYGDAHALRRRGRAALRRGHHDDERDAYEQGLLAVQQRGPRRSPTATPSSTATWRRSASTAA